MEKLSIVVTNFNGVQLLQKTLPLLMEIFDPDGKDRELILVDDGSEDSSVAYVKENFGRVKIMAQSVNRGFIAASNLGVATASHPVVFLFNNDIFVEPGFIEPILKHFEDPRTFAVVPRCITLLDGESVSESIAFLLPYYRDDFIFLRVTDANDPLCRAAGPVLHASGGFGAFDREKFLSLGGFDELFAPFYWEDVDLSFNAWRRGWQVLYEPASMVQHISHATIGRFFPGSYVHRVFYRNFFYFVWKNFSTGKFLRAHFRDSIRILSTYPQDVNLIDAFLEAFKNVEQVLKSRGQAALGPPCKMNEADVIAFFAAYLKDLSAVRPSVQPENKDC